ncbi:NAD-dependent deacylase [Accumulibacter sp.]|uniref:NAD-dependent deacylase n=1 Tax=Accumulibacter sp. TaxID=2053492 RepID=UPI0025DA1C6D|nr:NAD-dependent deacylase [Accumulibacter sp.]MCM8596425.1 NAD-dependent deacylase [Accumulibacter sp.]MCM8626309.1 NAD-dependent deacylase [Accumulibacter sp.]MDS4050574.1 NAD-dependent deacylase [Accumulibacter sp.]
MILASVLDEISARLASARRVLFITGAGISADSGLPTYRGVGGLYDGEVTEEGLPIETVLSGAMFSVRPDITWKYLAQIERNCRGALPNAAHLAIAELEATLDHVLVFTQNVDGLHRKAGSKRLIEIHGNLHDLVCTSCDFAESVEDLSGRPLPPVCPACGGVLRPLVVLFGEALPESAIGRLVAELEQGMDMVFTIGTSGVFPYIAAPVVWAAEAGIPSVEINPLVTRLTPHVTYHLPIGAAEAMGAIRSRVAALRA